MEPEDLLPYLQGSPVEHILNHMQPVHTFPPFFLKVHFNIIFPSTAGPSKLSLPFRISNQNIICLSYLSYACYMPRTFHPPWYLMKRKIVKLLIM